jgi:hypothetical protein
VTLAARRRLALVLVVLLTAATVAAAALITRGGSESESDVPSDVANCSDAFNVDSDAFNFGDAVGCGPSAQRRANARERPGPPE